MKENYPKLIQSIGNTPLVQIRSPNPKVTILAKLEMFNPSASIKDRIAHYILDKALSENLITSSTHIIEGSSGNTGASIAMVCASLGLSCTIFVPDKTSDEKISLIKSYGAEVIIKPTSGKGNEEYSNAARIAYESHDNAYFVNQYNNQWNLDAHYYTTGKEIWEQTNGDIDFLVATASTGGTICGVSKYLKQRNSSICTVLADPIGSIYKSYFDGDPQYLAQAKSYLVEGAGKHRLVDVIDFSLIDKVMTFSDSQAFYTALNIAKSEGISSGGSSGGNAFVAFELAKQIDEPATIVTLFPDSGLKYLSKFYNKKWLGKHLI